jgi:hypothetical protein
MGGRRIKIALISFLGFNAQTIISTVVLIFYANTAKYLLIGVTNTTHSGHKHSNDKTPYKGVQNK